MTPNEIQNELNRLQAELDKLKQSDTYFPESGEVVWVSNDLEEWHKRIFIKFLGFNSSPYKCVWENKSNTTKNYLLGKNYITSDWAYCRRLDGRIIPFGKDLKKEWKSDRTHLLPDGYEFCDNDKAELFLQITAIQESQNQDIGTLVQSLPNSPYDALYNGVRKIQYNISIHERFAL